jgi:hypothetical protein
MSSAKPRAPWIRWSSSPPALPGTLVTAAGDYEGITKQGRSNARPNDPIEPNDIPPQDQQAALQVVADRLEEKGPMTSLLAWGVEDAELTDFERTLLKTTGHLGAVFNSPHQRLRNVEHIDPVDRAAKPAHRAIPALASRPQDWGRRTVGGIEPQRVLNRRLESDLAIYENLLALALLRRLLAYIRDRRRPLELFNAASTDVDEAKEKAAWWVTHRSFERWAQAIDAAQRETMSRTLRTVRQLERQLSALRDAPLARGLPRFWGHRPPGLVMTNLLREDKHYRHVARLWVALDRLQSSQRESSLEQQSRFRTAAFDFEDYCGALIVQALEPHVSGHEFALPSRGDAGRGSLRSGSAIRLLRRTEGTFTLTVAEHSLELVPLYSSITTENARRAVNAAESPKPTVILYLDPLYPAVTSDTSEAWRVNRFSLPSGGRVGLVPVAPSSLRSVERVGQVITWHIYRTSFNQAWALLTVPTSLRGAAEDCLTGLPSEEGRYRLARPLSEKELGSYAATIEERARTIHGGPDHRRQTANDARRLIADLRDRQRHFSLAMVCPVCQKEMTVHAGRDGRWETRCRECQTRLFYLPCPHCGEPTIGALITDSYPDGRLEPEWVTRWAGAAVVDRPCWSTPGAFICSSCGMCGLPRPDCTRCRVQASPHPGDTPRSRDRSAGPRVR